MIFKKGFGWAMTDLFGKNPLCSAVLPGIPTMSPPDILTGLGILIEFSPEPPGFLCGLVGM